MERESVLVIGSGFCQKEFSTDRNQLIITRVAKIESSYEGIQKSKGERKSFMNV